MDKDKLKLIIRNLELLVDSLKTEVYADKQSYSNYDEVAPALYNHEVFDDDVGYPDWWLVELRN